MFAHEFADEETPLFMLTPLLHKCVMSASNMKKYGYTKTHLIIFIALSLKENLTMSQIAGYISSSKEQATRAVASLVDAGYAERHTDPENRTKIHIRLTEAGISFVKEFQETFHKNLRQSMDAALTEEEKKEFRESALSMIRILRKLV